MRIKRIFIILFLISAFVLFGEVAGARSFPLWAYRARIVGAFFEPDESEQDIEKKLEKLKEQKVSVIIADCPLGWSYTAWNDDEEYQENLELIRRVVSKAHDLGLMVVWYLTGLELISSDEDRDPAKEHPDWLQISLEGKPISFSDISAEQEHWLEEGNIDVWVSPSSPYLDFYIERVKGIAETGVDGLWIDTVYLEDSIGEHGDLWPSTDRFGVQRFREETGSDIPEEEDWDDPNWRIWIIWRHKQIGDFLISVKEAAKQVDPDIVFFGENWNIDHNGSTRYANDPTYYTTIPDISTGHEICTIADRVDLGEKGMSEASLEEWLAFATMIKYARATDRGKPSWILTYGYKPPDAERLAGIILANGANYYETQGPIMAGSAGNIYRRRIFSWIKDHQDIIYETEPRVEVAVLYSSRSRDFLDQGGAAEFYDTSGTKFFSKYREVCAMLLENHIPFEIIIDNGLTSSRLEGYDYLVLPNVADMSDEEAQIIRDYVRRGGKIVTLGETGENDEWHNRRDENALEGLEKFELEEVGRTTELRTNAVADIYLELRQGDDFLSIPIVNLGKGTIEGLEVEIKLPEGYSLEAIDLRSPDIRTPILDYVEYEGYVRFTISELDIFGLVVVKLK